MISTETLSRRLTKTFFTVVIAATLSFMFLAAITSTPAYAIQETRVYTWEDGESQPNIPETITTSDGVVLTLVSTSTPTQSTTTGTTSQTFSKTVSTTCSASEISNIQSIVSSTYYINDSGYTGNIPRTRIEYTPIYTTETQTISTTATTITTSNSSSAIPTALRTTVYQGYTLQMTDVQFTDLGNGTYQATIYYSTTIPQQVFSHYAVTAYYSGTLTRTTTEGGSWSLTATYEGEDTTVEGEEAGETEEIVEEEVEEEIVEEENDEDLNTTDEDNSASVITRNALNTNTNNEETTEEGRGIPIVFILIGAGVLLVVVIVVVVIMVNRGKKNKQGGQQEIPAPQQIIGYDENGNPIYLDGAAATTVIGDAASTAEAMPPFIADDLEEPLECELIQVVGDGDDDQMPIAVLDVLPSIAEEIPTIITFPEVGDDEFIPTDGADYYIALETTEPLVSNQMMIVSNEGQLIYDGALVEQIRLDTEPLVHALNRTVPEEMVNNVSDLVIAYEMRTEELRIQRDAMKDEYLAAQMQTMEDDYSDFDTQNYNGAAYDEFITDGYNEFDELPQMDNEFGFDNTPQMNNEFGNEFDFMNDYASGGGYDNVGGNNVDEAQVHNGTEDFDDFDDDFPTEE